MSNDPWQALGASGIVLGILLVLALPYILFLVALWRMGTAQQKIASSLLEIAKSTTYVAAPLVGPVSALAGPISAVARAILEKDLPTVLVTSKPQQKPPS